MPTLRRLDRARQVVLAAVAALLTLAPGRDAGAQGAPGASLAMSASGGVRAVTVTARDYAFEAPDSIPAGRTLVTLVNKGGELHHAFLMRLDPGHTPAELLAAMQAAMQGGGPPPAWAHDVGGPNSPAPGASSAAVVNLQPGTHVLLCVIPSPDGKPHVMKGMVRPITVTAPSVVPAAHRAAGSLAPTVQMTLRDYAFDMSRPLTAGRHVLRVTNAAAQSHEVFIARLAPGKTARDLVAWVMKPEGPPPALPMGGTAAMAKGESNDVVLDLAPGEYGLYCFVPDAKDGKEHIAHGMIRQITVR